MKSEVIAATGYIHPHDLLRQTINKLHFISSMILYTDNDHGPLAMTDTVHDGLYQTISDITDTLTYIHNKLEETAP